jgi:hypothetical protein
MRRDRTDEELTLTGRAMAALGSIFISVPVLGLLWLLLNYLLGALSVHVMVWSIAGITVFTFLFPRAAPDLFAGLIDALFKLGR